MGFIVKDQYKYKWPVEVHVPSDSTPGAFDTQTFDAIFLCEPSDKAAERLVQLQAKNEKDFVVALLTEVWLGWDEGEVKDLGSTALPNNSEFRAAMLKWPFVRQALLAAYTASISGQAAQARKTKNS